MFLGFVINIDVTICLMTACQKLKFSGCSLWLFYAIYMNVKLCDSHSVQLGLNVNLYMICYEKVLLHFACDSVRIESECPEWWGGLLHTSLYGGMCGKY